MLFFLLELRNLLLTHFIQTRITVALAANTDRSGALQCFIIGRSNKPRCFNKKTRKYLGFLYRHNLKAWMTGKLFQEWIMGGYRGWQSYEGMIATFIITNSPVDLANTWQVYSDQVMNVLLLIDNSSSQIIDGLQLTVNVQPLPPSATEKVQPMNASIIAAYKRGYRRCRL